jgi:hypothetical protein
VLARTGKLAAASALPALLAACAVEPNPTVTGPDGQTLIRVTDGQNCHDEACVRLSPTRQEVSAPGHEAVAVPDDIDLSDGTVTSQAFARLVELAGRAPRITSGGNGGDGGGGGTVGGNPGGFN